MKILQLFEDITETTLYKVSDFCRSLVAGDEATIECTSHGGLIFYGNAICQKIQEARQKGVKFTAKVYGLAASTAADIVLSCDRIGMARTAAIMIHSAFDPKNSGKDEGITVANAAQLDIIRKRIPYTEKDLELNRWFRADKALQLGLIDFIFDSGKSESARLSAKYLASYVGDHTMEEERKEEIVEEVQEVKEEREEKPSIEDLFEALVDRVAKLEERVAKLEESRLEAACGDDEKQNARLSAIQAKIAAICAPCTPKVEIKAKAISAKAELDEYKAKHPNRENYIGEK